MYSAVLREFLGSLRVTMTRPSELSPKISLGARIFAAQNADDIDIQNEKIPIRVQKKNLYMVFWNIPSKTNT